MPANGWPLGKVQKMNNWMKDVGKERTTDELNAYAVIDKINTHLIGDGNTMVIVVYRVEYEENFNNEEE